MALFKVGIHILSSKKTTHLTERRQSRDTFARLACRTSTFEVLINHVFKAGIGQTLSIPFERSTACHLVPVHQSDVLIAILEKDGRSSIGPSYTHMILAGGILLHLLHNGCKVFGGSLELIEKGGSGLGRR